MSSSFPAATILDMRDDHRIHDWISLALRAPSGDNCQPWVFEHGIHEFVIRIDPVRSAHVLDDNQLASFLSLGMLAESFFQAGQALGISCKLYFQSDSSLRVQYEVDAPIENLEVINVILSRQTNRGPYQPLDVMSVLCEIDEILHEGDRPIIPKMVMARGPFDQKTMDLWAMAESRLWRFYGLFHNFCRWVRFRQSYKDGIHFSNCYIKFDEIPLLFFLKYIPRVIHFVPASVVNFKVRSRFKTINRSTPAYVLFLAPEDTSDAFYQAGRDVMRFWLAAQSKGLVCHPLTIQSFFVSRFVIPSVKNDHLRHQVFSKEDKDLFFKTQLATRSEFSIDQKLPMAFMFRVGRPTLTFTSIPRRPLIDFFTKLP